jgi:hypothetical protein
VPIIAGEVSAGHGQPGLVRISSFTGESFLTRRQRRRTDPGTCLQREPDHQFNDEETYTQGLTVTLLDFGQSPDSNVNKPTTVPDGAVLTSRTLDPGSIVLARKIGDQDLYVSSTIIMT